MATLTEPKAEKKTLVHYLVEGGVAIIELDDPPANTYTYDMMHQLDEAILQARFDDTAHVIVLRGHGEKFFSAGANIAYLNRDRKSTRLNSSHDQISYAVFCLKKKNNGHLHVSRSIRSVAARHTAFHMQATT